MPEPQDTADRWGQVEQLFHAALQQPMELRAAFLDQACGGDAGLRGEVESLLARNGAGDWLFERPALAHAALPESPAWSAGMMIGTYRVLGLLGAGGMGEVFRARDTRLGRDVALKTLVPAVARDRTYLDRFRREAHALASLNHPNVATLYGIEEADGAFVLVMELVEGETLTQRMARCRMKLADSLAIAIATAEAVEAAHRKGVIHRDLKPGNVMITPAGKVKVLDFGLAKRVEGWNTHPDDATLTASPTSAGTVLGTVGYMSPEQAEGRDVDSRSDIFSFGTVLYEMLTGRRAFKGDTAARTLTAVLRDEPEPIELHAPGVSKDLARIVRFCLRKDPERRYQSITDVKLALQEVQTEPGATDLPPVVRTVKRRWIVLAVMVVAAGAAWSALTRSSESQAPIVVTPLTMFSGVALNPAVSPDGKMVAFEWDGDRGNVTEIYLKMIGGGEPLRLTGGHPAPDRFPVWSPDGRAIAFSRYSSIVAFSFRAAVMIVPALGGAERRVGSGWVQDWSPDGSTLLVARDDPGEGSGHFLISLRDGESRRLTTLPPLSNPGPASFSPDGRSVYYLEFSSGRSHMFQIPVEGGKPEPIAMPGFQFMGRFGWARGGRDMILYGIREHSTGRFYRIPVSGGQARLLPFGAGYQFSISRLGTTAVFVKGESANGIWRVGAWAGMNRQPAPWGTNGGANWTPVFSADGARAAFASSRSDRWQIWTSQADGREEVAVTRFGGGEAVGSPTWSPDGSQLAFDCDLQAGSKSICVVPTAGGAPRVLNTGSTADYVPAWSPDGQWIYFTSDRSGRSTIWRIPAAGGSAQQITKGGGFTSRFSPDGKYLYYLKSKLDGELWRAPAEGGVEERLLPEFATRNFWVLPEGVYLLDSGPSVNSMVHRRARARFYRFRTKQLEDLGFETEKPVSGQGICLSPDGKWLFYTQVDHDSANLMLVENLH